MSEPLRLHTHMVRYGTNTWTIDRVYRCYREPIARYLYQLCGSTDLAEELTQETFLRALVGWMAFRGDCSAVTWLFRIARNTYLNSLRMPAAAQIDTDEFLAIPDKSHDFDPVQQHAASEQRTLIQLALGQLPEKQRSVLLLRDAEGLAYAEIADVLDISLAAVKVNLFRARAAFRAAYAAFDRKPPQAGRP